MYEPEQITAAPDQSHSVPRRDVVPDYTTDNIYGQTFYDPTFGFEIVPVRPRQATLSLLEMYNFGGRGGERTMWTAGQLEIIDCILHRSSPDGRKRVQVVCSTQYGKSYATAVGVILRAHLHPEKWAIVAGTEAKAKIIMDYVIMFALQSPIIREQLSADTSWERLKVKKSANRLSFKGGGEVRVYSANSTRKAGVPAALMGLGCIVAGAMIDTEEGEMEISDVVKGKGVERVWSYNHKTGVRELRRVLSYQVNPLSGRKLFRLTAGGRSVVLTQDHPVWLSGRGYVPASEVVVGDVCMGVGLTNSGVCTHGSSETLVSQTPVNIVDVADYREVKSIGQTRVGSIYEKHQIGSGFAPCAISDTTEVAPESEVVYNLEVEGNHNYFVEGVLLHNSPNVVEDESALVGDQTQATVLRMLGGERDNFLMKIGNPFNRNHFMRTWRDGDYYRIFIDYRRALAEGRYTPEFIAEMKQEALFDILYGCEFEAEGGVDEGGWVSLLTSVELERAMSDEPLFGNIHLGVDVAGAGQNSSVIVGRAYNVAKIYYRENEPDTMRFSTAVLGVQQSARVRREDVFIDGVGIGKGVCDRLAQMGVGTTVLAGERPSDRMRFMNRRMELYWRLREWILGGGKLVRDDLWMELTKIKFRKVDNTGKLQLMGKEQMLREGVDSPDVADALALTFYKQHGGVSGDSSPEYEVDVTMNIMDLDPYAQL